MTETRQNHLGAYLKDRRARINPANLSRYHNTRRRTPGLRREEVAQRANISVTWYTWLEQGRGGTPSVDMLDRIAEALELGDLEREHLYLLAQNRPPEVKTGEPATGVSQPLQGMLDALGTSPAIVRDPLWNVVAWNEAAAAVLVDYAALPLQERNVLYLVFCHPRVRGKMPDWEATARFVVGSFRESLVRAGAGKQATSFIKALAHRSSEFAAMWHDHDIYKHCEGNKRVMSPNGSIIALNFLSLSVESHAGLSLIVYTPASQIDLGYVEDSIRWRRSQI